MHRVRHEDLPFVGFSHRHPYDKVAFVLEGRELTAGPGDILVVKAGEVHTFRTVGEGTLVQLGMHLSPTFIQEDMD